MITKKFTLYIFSHSDYLATLFLFLFMYILLSAKFITFSRDSQLLLQVAIPNEIDIGVSISLMLLLYLVTSFLILLKTFFASSLFVFGIKNANSSPPILNK